MANLQKLNIHPALSNWVSAFLSNRMQATRIAGVLSDWKSPNGGIPQGTKLDVILFLLIDPLEYNTTVLRPITIGNTTIEKVKKYKLLGVILTVDLK